MDINVILATNRIQIETFDGDNLFSSVTYINIVAVSRGEDIIRLVTAPTPSGDPTTTTTQDNFIVRLHLADQKHVDIPLAYVQNQPGWTNDQAGYEQAEIDIYANFPGVSGSGPVDSVTASAPLHSSGGANPNISHLNSGVTPGTYTNANITVDAKGHVTAAANGSGASLLVGNTLYVDAVNGNDGTGTRGDASLPYLTIAAAIADAQLRDLIVIREGDYQPQDIADTPSTVALLSFQLEGLAQVRDVIQSNGTEFRVYGDVQGDVDCSGDSITSIRGRVKGNATCAGTNSFLEVTWSVEGNLSISGGISTLRQGCNGNVVCTGGVMNLKECIIEGNLEVNDAATVAMSGTVIYSNVVNNGTTPQPITSYQSTVKGSVDAGITFAEDTFHENSGSTGDVATRNADGSWSWAPGGGSLLTGNTLWVDAVNGDDGTGTRGNESLPFLTINAAIAAANEGDCIVIRPGAYAGLDDTGGNPTVLSFFLMPGATGVDVTIDDVDTVWSFYGAPVGDVGIDASAAYAYFYGGVTGTFACNGFNSAFIYNVVGSINISGCTLALYNCVVTTSVTLESDAGLYLYQSSIGAVSTSTSASINGVGAAITGGITGAITIAGDVFYSSGGIVQPTPNTIAKAGDNGEWTFWGTQVILNDQTLNMTGVERTVIAINGDPSYVNACEVAAGYQLELKCNTTAPYTLTFTPFGTGTVDGAATLVLLPGQSAVLVNIGSDNWTMLVRPQPVEYSAVVDAADLSATLPVNDFPMTFTWSSPSSGTYQISADSGAPFIAGHTFADVTPGGATSICHGVDYPDASTVVFTFFKSDNGSITDPAFFTANIQVR